MHQVLWDRVYTIKKKMHNKNLRIRDQKYYPQIETPPPPKEYHGASAFVISLTLTFHFYVATFQQSLQMYYIHVTPDCEITK